MDNRTQPKGKAKKKTPVNLDLSSRFSVLDQTNPDPNVKEKKSIKKTPPLFVSGVKDSAIFRKVEIDPIVPSAKLKAINRTQIKVIVDSIDDFKKIVSKFRERKVFFHHVTLSHL